MDGRVPKVQGGQRPKIFTVHHRARPSAGSLTHYKKYLIAITIFVCVICPQVICRMRMISTSNADGEEAPLFFVVKVTEKEMPDTPMELIKIPGLAPGDPNP